MEPTIDYLILLGIIARFWPLITIIPCFFKILSASINPNVVSLADKTASITIWETGVMKAEK